jgi:hypothetical protein
MDSDTYVFQPSNNNAAHRYVHAQRYRLRLTACTCTTNRPARSHRYNYTARFCLTVPNTENAATDFIFALKITNSNTTMNPQDANSGSGCERVIYMTVFKSGRLNAPCFTIYFFNIHFAQQKNWTVLRRYNLKHIQNDITLDIQNPIYNKKSRYTFSSIRSTLAWTIVN